MDKTIEDIILEKMCRNSISTETTLHYHRPAGKIDEKIKISGDKATILIGIENLLIITLKQFPKEEREHTLQIFTKNVKEVLRDTEDERN